MRRALLLALSVFVAACGEERASDSRDGSTPSDGRLAEETARLATAPARPASVRPSITLPVVSTATTLPPAARSMVVVLSRDGGAWVEGEPVVDLEQMNQAMRRRTQVVPREPDGSSLAELAILADEEVPFGAILWTMQAGAGQKVHRIHFGVRHRASGEEGAIATDLPKDRGMIPTPQLIEPFRSVRVALSAHETGTATTPGDVYAALVRLRKERPDLASDTRVEIAAALPHGPRVRHGYAMRVLDAVRSAGFEEIVFKGLAPPRKGETLAEAIRGLSDSATAAPLVTIDERAVGGEGAEAARIPDGSSPSAGMETSSRTVAAADGPKQPAPPRAVPTEPIAKDLLEEALAEMALSDAPFEGPSNNAIIGTGGGAGGAFRGRGARRAPEGADPDELGWLAAHQSPDGRWESAGFGAWCNGKAASGPRPDGAGDPAYDVGVTGLALLAFLGAGDTNRGEHASAKVVGTGLRYLKSVQDPEGCFGPRDRHAFVYRHAIATLAMVEAYGMTGSAIYKGPAQKALDFVAVARNPGFAWRYGVKPGDNDTSITGWMTLALASAALINAHDKASGKSESFTIDESAFDGVRAWLDRATDPETGRTGEVSRDTGPARPPDRVARFPGTMSESTTAIGVLLRALTGEDPATSEPIRKGVDICLRRLPIWADDGSIDMYYWLFGSLAMNEVGGEPRARWRAAMMKVALESQRKDGDPCDYRGSWDPADPWGPDGGRVYSTAMMALCLHAVHPHTTSRRPRPPAPSADGDGR